MIRGPSLKRGVTVAALALMWCALWGSVSVANIAGGLVLAVAVDRVITVSTTRGGVRLWPMLQLVALVLRDLVVSTASVAREVVTPTDRTHEAIVAVDVPKATRAHLLLVVVAVTVTPGTAVVDVDADTSTLYLHMLHYDRRADAAAHVQQLAALACAALPPPASPRTLTSAQERTR